MSLEDLIQKLPEIYQELARTHIKLLINLTYDELEVWTKLMLEGDYEQAQANLIKQMSTQEAIDDTTAIKNIMKELNKEAKAQADTWREFFLQIILIGLLRLKEEE